MEYKIKIYDDMRIVVTKNFNPFINRKQWNGQSRSKNYDEFMSRKDYQSTIKRWCAKLMSFKFENEKCKFITLTLAEYMSYDDLVKVFNIFIKAVHRKFGDDVGYVRAFEFQEESNHLHIHIMLVFANEPKITKTWVKEHWKYGFIDCRNVTDSYGLCQYFTIFNPGNCQIKCYNATYFPHGAKIISTSNNLKLATKREITINESELKHLVDYHENKYYGEDGKLVRTDGHYYTKLDGKKGYCWDKIIIQSDNNFIYNNYGTVEDDIILENNKVLDYFNENKQIDD